MRHLTHPACALSLAAAFIACGTDSPLSPAPQAPPTFSATPDIQWSGGKVTLRSPLFARRAELPTIRVADILVAPTRVDDTTVTFAVPVMPSQRAAITVTDRLAGYVADSLDVRGLRTSSYPFYAPINLAGMPTIFGSPNGPVAIASYPLGGIGAYGGLASLNLRQGTVDVTQGVSLVRWDLSVGASYLPSHFLAKDTTGQNGEWSLFPLTYVGPLAVSGSRFSVQLNPTTWLAVSNHSTTIHRTGQADVDVALEDPYRPQLSVTADRAIMSSANRAPVFAMSTGDVVYSLPLHAVSAATFSPDGQVLFVAGDTGGSHQMLTAYRAADGLERGAVTLEDRATGPYLRVSALGLNTSGTLLFLTGEVDAHLVVWVYDSTTLERIGQLSSNEAFPCSCDFPDGNLASTLDEARATFFVLQAGIPTRIFQFDLPPTALARRTGP